MGRGDAQNVEQALRAPVFEQGLELEVGSRRVKAHDGVRDVDLVLLGEWSGFEVVCGEVAVEVGKLLGELVRHEALGFRVGLIEWFFAVVANSGAEGHELVDALDVGGFEALVRPREELEPLEGARKGVWIRRERLGVCGLIRLLLFCLLLLAGLREELGVLLEDLEVLLYFLFGI